MNFLHLRIENYLFIYSFIYIIILLYLLWKCQDPEVYYAAFKIPHSLQAFSLLIWFANALPM